MSDRQDPYNAYNFKVLIGQDTVGHFTECSGIGAHVEVINYRESGQGQVVKRLPGRVTYKHVTLSYGLTNELLLWNWFQSVIAGKVERKNVSIVLIGSDGSEEAMRWDLIDCWPTDWDGAAFCALSQEVAVERLTLTYETLKRIP